MTKQEFIMRQRELARSGNRFGIVWIIFFFGTLIAGIPAGRYVEHHKELSWLDPLLVVGLFVFLVGQLLLFLWFARRQQREFGHRCPGCGKVLANFLAQVAIATNHCGHCGQRVFEDKKID